MISSSMNRDLVGLQNRTDPVEVALRRHHKPGGEAERFRNEGANGFGPFPCDDLFQFCDHPVAERGFTLSILRVVHVVGLADKQMILHG